MPEHGITSERRSEMHISLVRACVCVRRVRGLHKAGQSGDGVVWGWSDRSRTSSLPLTSLNPLIPFPRASV